MGNRSVDTLCVVLDGKTSNAAIGAEFDVAMVDVAEDEDRG